jgi:hypothetical protein
MAGTNGTRQSELELEMEVYGEMEKVWDSQCEDRGQEECGAGHGSKRRRHKRRRRASDSSVDVGDEVQDHDHDHDGRDSDRREEPRVPLAPFQGQMLKLVVVYGDTMDCVSHGKKRVICAGDNLLRDEKVELVWWYKNLRKCVPATRVTSEPWRLEASLDSMGISSVDKELTCTLAAFRRTCMGVCL